jgi:hypothetical protein
MFHLQWSLSDGLDHPYDKKSALEEAAITGAVTGLDFLLRQLRQLTTMSLHYITLWPGL